MDGLITWPIQSGVQLVSFYQNVQRKAIFLRETTFSCNGDSFVSFWYFNLIETIQGHSVHGFYESIRLDALDFKFVRSHIHSIELINS